MSPCGVTRPQWVNSLAAGRSGCNFKNVIINHAVLIGIFRSCNNALRWTPWDLMADESTLVQVMAWYHQATSHYLNQCWLRSLKPCGVTRPLWVDNSQKAWLPWATRNCLRATRYPVACYLYQISEYLDYKWYFLGIIFDESHIRSTYWSLNKMDGNLQTTYWNSFF